MKNFSQLFIELDHTTKTLAKLKALVKYLDNASDEDKLWCIAVLIGKKPKRPVNSNYLKEWVAEQAGLPFWLFNESYHVVGDLAETISLVLPQAHSNHEYSLSGIMHLLIEMRTMDEIKTRETLEGIWLSLDKQEKFVFSKLITGGFRIGISQKLMVRALAEHLQEDENKLSHRLMGNWTPQTTTFKELLVAPNPEDNLSQPYPFYLAYALENEPEDLGDILNWQIERKWDGIRGQIIKRAGKLYVWSRGEELITDKFPEFGLLNELLPDGTVLDGEILAFRDGAPLPFQLLQTRIGRKNVTSATLKNSPVAMVSFDLLEYNGNDMREQPLKKRRLLLEKIVAEVSNPVLQISEVLQLKNWEEAKIEREKARDYQSEGFMMKEKDSLYRVGRKKGGWWKWKLNPLTIDAVLIYAMRGHGRRANLYTDYTFALWKGDELVPFTKAYSGLTDAEIRQVDNFVKKNTLERFGPVRSVKTELVFEIAFEGIARSNRHKSGVSLRFPRMHRWRRDKKAEEANTLDDLLTILKTIHPESPPKP